jgi:uncharacterized membrane protein YfcA
VYVNRRKLNTRVAKRFIRVNECVGSTPPVIAESMIFVAAIVVDPKLLATTIASAAVGAWLGAGVVARLPRRAICNRSRACDSFKAASLPGARL